MTPDNKLRSWVELIDEFTNPEYVRPEEDWVETHLGKPFEGPGNPKPVDEGTTRGVVIIDLDTVEERVLTDLITKSPPGTQFGLLMDSPGGPVTNPGAFLAATMKREMAKVIVRQTLFNQQLADIAEYQIYLDDFGKGKKPITYGPQFNNRKGKAKRW